MTDLAEAHMQPRPGAPAPGLTRFRTRWAVALAIVAALAMGLVAFFRQPQAPPSTKRPIPALTVTTAAPSRTTWPTELSASGPIAPWQEASVGTQIGGFQLVQVLVNVGDQVRRGQLLARFDPALLRADEAELIASHDQAEANRKRALGLQGSGAISDQEVLQFVTAARRSAALLSSKRLQLRYTNVVAPDDGVVSARTATLGLVVPAGQELFRIIRQNRLEWRGELTASQLVEIKRGQRVSLTLPDGSKASALVRETAPSLDGQTRLGVVYAELAPGSRARGGMYASGRLIIDQSPALIVPAESVIIRDGRNFVVRLDDHTSTPRVALSPVELGRRRGDSVEVTFGLTGAERLVQGGAGFLKDGDIVRIADALRAAPVAAPGAQP